MPETFLFDGTNIAFTFFIHFFVFKLALYFLLFQLIEYASLRLYYLYK